MKHMRVNDSDRELLELAAKAAGIDWWRVSEGFDNWNPLDDDGDAMRLAIKLDIVFRRINGVAFAWKDGICDMQEPYSNDPFAAIRRAIVRAAVEIGINT